MKIRDKGNFDETILRLTFAITQLVTGLKSRINQAKEYELLLFGYQISTMIHLLVRLHTQFQKKQIALGFMNQQRIPLDISSEAYQHVLASINQLSQLIRTWKFPHKHIVDLIEEHLSHLHSFYFVEERSNQHDHVHDEAVFIDMDEDFTYEEEPLPLNQEEDATIEEPMPMPTFVEEVIQPLPNRVPPKPPLLAKAVQIQTPKTSKSVRPKPPLLAKAATVQVPAKNKSSRSKPIEKAKKVRVRKKVQGKRKSKRLQPHYLSKSVMIRLGNKIKLTKM
jgi:hypothetical protein